MAERLFDEIIGRVRAHATAWLYLGAFVVAVYFGAAAGEADSKPLLLVVGAIGLAVLVWEPALALIGVFVTMVFGAYLILRLPGVTLTAAKLAVGAAFASWGIRSYLERSVFLRIMPVTPVYLVAAFGTMIAIQGSVEPSRGFVELSTMALLLLMNQLLYTAVTPRRFVMLMNGVVAATLVALLAGGLAGRFEGERLSGLVRNANEWGMLVMLIGPMSVGWLLSSRHPSRVVLLPLLIMLIPLNVFQTASRAVIAAWLVTLPFLAWSLRKERAILVGMVPLGAAMLAILAPQMALLGRRIGALVSGDRSDSSVNMRGDLLQYGLDLFWEHPLIGLGPGMSPTHTAMLFPLENSHPFHNSYLTLIVEQGALGGVCHAVLVAALAATVLRGIRSSRTERLRATGAGIGISLMSFLCVAATGDVLMSYPLAHFVLGLGLVVERMSRETGPLPPALADPPSGAAAALEAAPPEPSIADPLPAR